MWEKIKCPPVGVVVCGMTPTYEIKLVRRKENGVFVTDGRKSHPVRIIAWMEVGR